MPFFEVDSSIALVCDKVGSGDNVFTFDSQLGPAFSNSAVTLNGDASIVSGQIEVVSDKSSRSGSAWYPTPVSILNGFQATFTFQTSGGQGAGLAFVIQADNVNAIGRAASGMGYDQIKSGASVGVR